MAITPPAWRCVCRGRGLALDRLLPDALKVPALVPDALRQRVPYTVQIPGETKRYKLDAADNVVLDAADFVVGAVWAMCGICATWAVYAVCGVPAACAT